MPSKSHLQPFLYATAIMTLSVVATFFARWAFGHTFFLFMLLGVVVSSIRGGVLAGIVATVVGAIEYAAVTVLLFGKHNGWADTDLSGVFIAVSLVIAWLAGERQEALARLANVVQELQTASEEVKTLRGLIPICAGCKKIRDEEGLWVGIERYLEEHTEAQMTHGMCRDCVKRLYPDVYARIYPEPPSS